MDQATGLTLIEQIIMWLAVAIDLAALLPRISDPLGLWECPPAPVCSMGP
ncbi:hypothetical protein JHC09_10065 [Devosia sp. MC532]|nr:hypothetical protein [Devosia sp. MC532]